MRILDGFGKPADGLIQQWRSPIRHSSPQQNMAAGQFLRKAGKFLRNPTAGKYRRATSTSDCGDCCSPNPCGKCSNATECVSVSFSGIGLAPLVVGSCPNLDPANDTFILQPYSPCQWVIGAPASICGQPIGCDRSSLFISMAIAPDGSITVQMFTACHNAFDTDSSLIFLGSVSGADAATFCGSGTGTGSSGGGSLTIDNSYTTADPPPTPDGIGINGSVVLTWGATPCPSPTYNWGAQAECGFFSCSGTGTGSSSPPNPCANDCPCSGGACTDTQKSYTVDLNPMATCDPDLLGIVAMITQVAGCPNAHWTGTAYFGNVQIDLTFESNCYWLKVVHTIPGGAVHTFCGYATTAEGPFTYCSGDCMTAPTIGQQCPGNCTSQCGDCTQLGTTFSFVAATNGQLRLIYNDQYGSFYNNSGSFSVVFTTGDTGTYACDGTATNGSPGPAVVAGTTYAGTASGVCFWDVTAPCSSNADGIIQSGSNPGCTTVGGTDCSSLTFGSLVAQICTAADIYCDGICDDSLSSVSIDTTAFNDGLCTSSNSDTASLSGTCVVGTIVWTGTYGIITYNQSCYTLTLTFPCGTWTGTCCTPTGFYCGTGVKGVVTVEVS